jgi:glycosyltransferase involved in cell wall biosynthesis
MPPGFRMKTTAKMNPGAKTPESPDEVELSVVMPCLNEVRTVGRCVTQAIEAINRLGISGEVIVADNGSTDGSVEKARSRGARVVRAEQIGYGSALRTGCLAARGRYIIMGDSDGAHDYSDIDPFVEKLGEGSDLVVGNRFKGEILPGSMSWKNRYIGNPLLSRFLRVLFSTQVSDAHCGLRGFTKAAFRRMNLRSQGMEFASEMLIKAAKLRLNTSEVPITQHPDGRGRPPHLRPFRDGWRHVKLMLMFSPTALFLVPGLGLMLLGIVLMGSQLFAPQDRPLLLFGLRFDIHWAILGSVIALVGYQIITVHFFARVYSVTHRLREDDRLLDHGFRLLNLDRVLVLASVAILCGLILDAIVAVRWLRPEVGLESIHTRLFILGSTLLALGVQTFFNAFFFSILGDAYKAERVVKVPSSTPAETVDSSS